MSKTTAGTTLVTRIHELPLAEGDARIFISVADTGSFTAAAALYNLSPSAVSKAVSRLESALGVRLMARTTRALHLTEEGVAFHARCSKAFQLLAEAAEEATQGTGELSGVVRIGLPSLFGTYLVGTRLPELLETHPKLRVDLVTTMRPTDIVERGLDFMIVVGQLPDSSLVARPLGYGQFVTVASPAYLAGAARLVECADLAGHRCLAFLRPDGRQDAWNFLLDGETQAFEVNASARSDDMHHLASMAIAGAGVAHLPMFLVAQALARGELVGVLADVDPPAKLASFVYAAGQSIPRRVRVVIEHLQRGESMLPGTSLP
ncbi:MAG: LysR family transcriptional regulator [Variovorax sp.]